MRVLPLAVLLSVACAGVAWGHDAPTGWAFDPWCCNGDDHDGDCHLIPTESVHIVTGGYQVVLRPGDHPMVTREHVFFKPFQEVRFSPDGLFYACLYPNEDTLRCLYSPSQGS